ncbi:DUF1576 domain-containing protein [Thiocystis violascens]|uniref:Archaeal/vacuolar-type H+-ATPase subunit I n=1 Tax=Thiocystis violascens (strain ATCC 17096 / DSM 198 / 6111) TaxID=765911 RepID=I3Y8Q9_THIV6|nr:DUF1576 domain-containing protein [Thiocystis violascens]AFL73377.1 archaeal/vacuolar-type H+-ATPase subunit I [Thiocystis violascens DSM 198]
MPSTETPDDATHGPTRPARETSDRLILLVISGYAALFVVFGFLVSSPTEIGEGLVAITTSRDTLLSDYFGVGGVGAGFVNAGLLTLSGCLVYSLVGARITGAAVAALFLLLGFGLFGKNLLNIWFIVLGVALYARFKGQPFATHINAAFFGVALAPVTSEILFSSLLPVGIAVPLGIGTGVLIGFILPPVAAQVFKAHMGFALYNMGFAAGLVGVLIVALFKSYGFVPDPVLVWTSGNNALLGGFLGIVLATMLAIGILLDREAPSGLQRIMRESGQAPSDFIAIGGFGATLVNMALSGAIGLAYVLAVGGDLNGPVIGAILSIMGFAAFGKHPNNFVPIIIGVFLGSLAKPWHLADPSILLVALFGTNLAPIAGRFGWGWGIAAGFLHSSTALSVGVVHGGLNLYNNGFAAGIVAAVLVPIIVAIQSDRARV